jgi:hypothetical protein
MSSSSSSATAEVKMEISEQWGGTTYINITTDNYSNGDSNAPFDRYYYSGTSVTITCPDTYNGKAFERWVVNVVTSYYTTTIVLSAMNETVVVHYAD